MADFKILTPETIDIFAKRHYDNPSDVNNEEFEEIVNLLTTATIEYLLMQIKSGADVIKIFDSWAGALNADMVLRYSLNPIKKIVSEIRKNFN